MVFIQEVLSKKFSQSQDAFEATQFFLLLKMVKCLDGLRHLLFQILSTVGKA